MNRSIGERIKNRRKELNITQIQIRKATGISSGNMSGIESGKSLPSASALIELSKILDCSVDWILTGNLPISGEAALSDTEKELLSGFRQLHADDREELIEILRLKLRKYQNAKGENTKGENARSFGLKNTEKGSIAG